MPEPLVEVVWLCRDCGQDRRDGHARGCRFAPPPELRCARVVTEEEFMRCEHNAHGWEADGRRVFCPGGVQPRRERTRTQLIFSPAVVADWERRGIIDGNGNFRPREEWRES